ncbi:MAG: manganese efflux pump MntP family protein [Phycisphaerae bacterium]|jgi:putative Mn2+ efflux pump MntP
MGLLTIIIIAIGLSMDAFAVAIVEGSTYERLHLLHAFRIAVMFGLFQSLMPVAGYFCGLGVRDFIEGYDHWVAFILLSVIGAKMIYESFKIKGSDKSSSGIVILLALSVATSIDALTVGVTLGLVKTSIATPAIIIGAVTFVLSYLGVYIGQKFGHFFESKIEAAGGLVLIGIGLKILLAHLY